jgi:Cell division protein SepF
LWGAGGRVNCYFTYKQALGSARKGRWCPEEYDSVLALLALGRLAAWFGPPDHDEGSSYFDASSGDLFDSPRRVSVINPKSFEETQEIADCFKRQQLVIVNLRDVDRELSKRTVDFCAGLTYALGGRVRPIADRLFLLTPHEVDVLDGEGEQLAEREFFNQL